MGLWAWWEISGGETPSRNTLASAQAIIRELLNNQPMPLLIQEDLVQKKKPLEEAPAEGVRREHARVREGDRGCD